MSHIFHDYKTVFFKYVLFLFLTLLIGVLFQAHAAQAASLNVIGVDNSTSPPTESGVALYRWLVEEDTTYHVNPGVQDPDTLAVHFHSSYMPVLASGDDTVSLPVLDPNKYYHVSVLPKEPGTYSIGGASFKGSDPDVTVHLNKLPLPPAQPTVWSAIGP